jgi:hypothetical protein
MPRSRRRPLGLTPDQIFGDEAPVPEAPVPAPPPVTVSQCLTVPAAVELPVPTQRSLAWLAGYALSELVYRVFGLFRRRPRTAKR